MLPLSMNDYMVISDDIRLTDSCFFHYPPYNFDFYGRTWIEWFSNGEGENFRMIECIKKYLGDFWRDLLDSMIMK